MRRHRTQHPPLGIAVLATGAMVLGLSSCADDAEPSGADAGETPSATTTSPSLETEPTEPSATISTADETPATDEPTETLTAEGEPSDAPAPVAVAAQLLPAERMGKLNEAWTWRVGSDYRREPKDVAVCHRTPMTVIGADKVAVRDYTSELDAQVRAFHLVARFADDVTARRGYAVLESWRDSCKRRLEEESKGQDGVHLSGPERVSSPADAASSYTVFQPTATGTTQVDNVAISRDGELVDLVVVRLEGDDFNYPRGRTPAAVAVRNAAEQRR
jgi:hypothetical protein